MAFPNPPCQGLRHSHISAGIQPSRNFALSARLRGEREGTLRGGDGEGEVGHAVATEPGLPHLTPTLSAPRDGEGDSISSSTSAPRCVNAVAIKGEGLYQHSYLYSRPLDGGGSVWG